MSRVHFRMLCATIRVRDLLVPRDRVLKEVDMEPGFNVLDYGCGPGSYVPCLSEMVGDYGRVYALDIQPLAVESPGGAP